LNVLHVMSLLPGASRRHAHLVAQPKRVLRAVRTLRTVPLSFVNHFLEECYQVDNINYQLR
jgi:hypothetical protein